MYSTVHVRPQKLEWKIENIEDSKSIQSSMMKSEKNQ